MTEREKLYQRAFQDLDAFLQETMAEGRTAAEIRRLITQLADDPDIAKAMRLYGKRHNQARKDIADMLTACRNDLS